MCPSLLIFFSNIKSKIIYCKVKRKNMEVNKIKSHSSLSNSVLQMDPLCCGSMWIYLEVCHSGHFSKNNYSNKQNKLFIKHGITITDLTTCLLIETLKSSFSPFPYLLNRPHFSNVFRVSHHKNIHQFIWQADEQNFSTLIHLF